MREMGVINYGRRFINFIKGLMEPGNPESVEWGFVEPDKLAYDFESFLCIRDTSEYIVSDVVNYSDTYKGVKSPVTVKIDAGGKLAIPTGITYTMSKKLKMIARPGNSYLGKIEVSQAMWNSNKDGLMKPVDLVLYIKNITEKDIVVTVGTEIARLEIVAK